jgi:hypothetical protein
MIGKQRARSHAFIGDKSELNSNVPKSINLYKTTASHISLGLSESRDHSNNQLGQLQCQIYQNSAKPANQNDLYLQVVATTWRQQAAHWRTLILS